MMSFQSFRRYASPMGLIQKKEYFKVIFGLFLVLMVGAPILSAGALIFLSQGASPNPAGVIIPLFYYGLTLATWMIQIASCWLSLAVIFRRFRDAFGNTWMLSILLGILSVLFFRPLLGFIFAPFLNLAPYVGLTLDGFFKNIPITVLVAWSMPFAILAPGLIGLICLGFFPTKMVAAPSPKQKVRS